MNKRNIVRLISFLSAAVVVLSGFMVVEKQKSKRLMLQIENNYSKSLNEFSSSVNNISALLQKARFTNSPTTLSRYAAELLTEAEISKSSLANLPYSAGLDTLNRFLSQAGNYAFAAASEMYNSGKMPKDYKNNIMELSKTAQKVANALNTAQINYDNLDYWATEIEDQLKETVEDTLSVSLSQIEGDLSDYPTLVYDGPYSDHILSGKSEMVENADLKSTDELKTTACEFLECDKNDIDLIAEEKGDIETVRFGNKSCNIALTKSGGYVLYMRKNRQITEHIISYKQALSKAKRFLEQKNMTSFIETYYFTQEGVCVINFAYLDGETICYTDLVKVGIALDNGEVMLYEAGGYITNHKTRAFETAVHTVKEAEKKVSSNLKIVKTAVALIPTKKGKEERCFEFTCTDGETDVLVYINVLDLKEEEVLILLKNDGGTLAK
jgi:germination protein YpeB